MLIIDKIKKNLEVNIKPTYLKVINESDHHHGMRNTETHFRIEVVSDWFNDKKRLERHRLVQDILKDELSMIKAFSLHAYSPREWKNLKIALEKSPLCQGSPNA